MRESLSVSLAGDDATSRYSPFASFVRLTHLPFEFTKWPNQALHRTGLGAVVLFCFGFFMVWFQLIDRLPSPSVSLGR